MCSETVVFHDISPMGIDHPWPLIPWAYPIPPVIFIRETSAGPPQVGNLYLFKCIHDIQPDPVFFGHFEGVGNPESVINATAKVFRKMPINMSADLMGRQPPINIHRYCTLCLQPLAAEQYKTKPE
jgi:hypothetical protein